jgi:hypothetical protein
MSRLYRQGFLPALKDIGTGKMPVLRGKHEQPVGHASRLPYIFLVPPLPLL